MAGDSTDEMMDLDLYLGRPLFPPFATPILDSHISFSRDPSSMDIDPPELDSVTGVGNNHMPHSPSHDDYNRQYAEVEDFQVSYEETTPSLSEVEVLNGPHTPSLPPPLPVSVEGSIINVPNSELEVPNAPYTPYLRPPLPVSSESSISNVPDSSNSRPTGEHLNGSSHRQELQHPEFRFQRLIDSNNRLQVRRFRSSVSHGLNRSDMSTLPDTELLIHDIVNSHESIRGNGKDKVADSPINVDESEDEEIEKRKKSAANFECNICLDVAKEPVVTSCGHLFCWPCLFQWLHVHSGHQECPVCKGEVPDSNITPIYGRGKSDGKKSGDGDSGLHIPPRPHGNRLEGARQHLPRPILRRSGEGISASFRRLLDEELRTGVRFDGNRETSLLDLFEAHRSLLARMRGERAQRGDENVENRSGRRDARQRGNSALNTQPGALDLAFEDGENTWRRLTLEGIGLSERLASISADLGRVVERLGGSNQAGSSTSTGPRNHEPESTRPAIIASQTSDHVSASGTAGLIERDVTLTASAGYIDGAEPSRPSRRRGRSRSSLSSDVDGTSQDRRQRWRH